MKRRECRVPSPGMQKKRQMTSVGSRPASPSRTRATTCSTAESGRKLVNVAVGQLAAEPQHPVAQRGEHDRHRLRRRRLELEAARPALAGAAPSRSIGIVSRSRVSGFSNGTSFQRSTITFDDEPRPSTKRPPLASASAAACWASTARPRVYGFTTPVPSRIRSVQAAASASGVKPSAPLVSPVHRSS